MIFSSEARGFGLVLARVRGRVAVLLAGVVVLLGVFSGVAAASVRPLLPVGSAAGRESSLSRVPAGLRAAAGGTLGSAGASGGKLTASDGAAGDLFGSAVAVSGSTAVVGAPDKNSDTGEAYVFAHTSTGWHEQATLTASHAAADDLFGDSVAISGSTAVIGAPGKSGTGAAYVFVRSGAKWSQAAKLTASDAAAGDHFGRSVAISGSTAVIGAPFKNSNTGEAYVFAHTSTGWHQRAKLTESPAAMGDLFGVAVAISGSSAVVSAEQTNSDTGAAYVFVRTSGKWSQQATLTASDAAVGDAFGNSVAISGSTAVIGDQSEGGDLVGAAYVFVRTSGKWSQQAKLTAADGVTGDAFGSAVAISGSTAVVGADGKNSGTGAAYEFVRTSGTWEQQSELTESHGASGDRFGSSVGISESTAVIGAPDNNSDTGAAYALALNPPCGTVLHHSVTLGSDMDCPSTDGLYFGASGITINLHGFTVTGSGYGIDNAGDWPSSAPGAGGVAGRGKGFNDDRVENGNITGTAILVDHTSGMKISNITQSDGVDGLDMYHSRNASITGSRFGYLNHGNSSSGASLLNDPNLTISSSSFDWNNAFGIYDQAGSGTLDRVTANHNDAPGYSGIQVAFAVSSYLIENSKANGNSADGFEATSNPSGTVKFANDDAENNGGWGFYANTHTAGTNNGYKNDASGGCHKVGGCHLNP